ncbi:MAG: calycin-like domain-containing protein [Tannerella sp.]|nr:calycin-like domain-containing protein [Tannerella sp.]
MKYRLFSMTVWLSALCMGFTACGDKENTEDNNYAKVIAGTYKGNLLMGGAPIGENTEITITRDDDNHATLKMNKEVMTLPVNIACKTDVTFVGNQYRISGNTTFEMGEGVSVPVTVNGTIDGAGKATININVEVPNIGPLAVVFDGQR